MQKVWRNSVGAPATNMTGATFGCLTVVRRAESDKHGRARWRCQCVCGAEAVFLRQVLIAGEAKSCGAAKCVGLARSSTGGKVSAGRSPLLRARALAEVYGDPIPREIDRSRKTWADASGAASDLARALRLPARAPIRTEHARVHQLEM